MSSIGRVLITGTTSGIGKALLELYYKNNWTVICVNRRDDPDQEQDFVRAYFKVLDICSHSEVNDFLKELYANDRFPNLFLLNAGINRPDNTSTGFDYLEFHEVLNTNLLGNLTFVSAARSLKKTGVTYMGFSSVSNIVPNPGHIAYSVSKKAILESYIGLQKNDPFNKYKVVVLGPMRTRIMRHHKIPNWQMRIFEALSRPIDEAALAISEFAENKKTNFHFPFRAKIFYLSAHWILKCFPFLYRGTK
jgi:NAD(P)-dependent dehydrogenase (short-subunit alcohol dehydrogenase family)